MVMLLLPPLGRCWLSAVAAAVGAQPRWSWSALAAGAHDPWEIERRELRHFEMARNTVLVLLNCFDLAPIQIRSQQ